MDFYQKYELLDLLKDEGVKVFNAREISTGRRITVFLFVGEQARLQADLLVQLRASQRPGQTDLLEVGDNQGTPYVATEPLGGLADLKRKVAVSPAPPIAAQEGRPPDAFTRVGVWHVPAPAPPAATTPPAPSAPGEFTRLFQASAPPQPMGEAAPPPPAPASPATPSAPGEFTRLFQASAPPRPMGETAPSPPPTPASPPTPSAPGEFTRLFQASAPPPLPPTRAPLPSPAAPPAQPGAGEFTRFFQSPLSQAPASEPVFPPPPAGAPQKPAPPAAPPPASSAPGEFTRIFGKGDMPTAPAAPPAGGSATLSFRVRPEVTPPATPAPSAGPGEYTRMFGAQPVLQPQTQAPAPAPTAARKVPWVMFALVVTVVVLLAVVAIMAFALRK